MIERESPGPHPAVDAVLITLPEIDETLLVKLLAQPPGAEASLPRLVILSAADPDAAAAALALGAADALAAPVHLPELCARLHARIRERRQALSAAEAQAMAAVPAAEPAAGEDFSPSEQQSETLVRKVHEEFERARRYSLSFSLILLGIDDLRSSDRLGPEAADRLREEVVQTLRRELRLPDFIVPYGRGEFAIVLPETGQAGARQSIVRVRERLTTLPFDGDPRLEPTRFSAGIVTYPHPAAFQTDDLFAMAEAALMRGKAQAGERIGMAM